MQKFGDFQSKLKLPRLFQPATSSWLAKANNIIPVERMHARQVKKMKNKSVPYAGCKPQHISQRFEAVQSFGGTHTGVDFAFTNCYGTFLTAPARCEVIKIITDNSFDDEFFTAYQRGYGILLQDCENPRLEYLFWHCLQIFPVMVGQEVQEGQVVAQLGNSGLCYSDGVLVPLKGRGTKGSHLHFEVRLDGKYVDPLDYIDFANQPKLDKMKAVQQFLIKMTNFISQRK